MAASKPSQEALERFLESQSALELTYQPVGATAAGECPPGFREDLTRQRLGEGKAVFEAAKAALISWRQFDLDWIECYPRDAAPKEDQLVAVVARAFGFRWANAARIIEVEDRQDDESRRFGVAYGTLPRHSASGEERFTVEMDEHGGVWYEIRAVSRPGRWYTWLGYPLQKRFGRDSVAAMRRAVAAANATRDEAA